MARTLDPQAHALRRDEFVDAAGRLMATRGYDQLSVQEVLDTTGASKGAFYHYFDSKGALLEAVVERMTATVVETVAAFADDATLPAPEKLRRLFAEIGSYKLERKELMLELVRVWFSDENVLMRDKFRSSLHVRLQPVLAAILAQGKAEGTFALTSPDASAAVLVALILGANETASRLFLGRQAGTISLEEVERDIGAYGEAFERILGAPSLAATIFDLSTIRIWYG